MLKGASSLIFLDYWTHVYSYGLVTEQKKGAYRYFADLGDRLEVASVRTAYVDEVGTSIFL